jgi:protein-S-isoprenylcysteine O-methyltransferase Ste14
VILFYNTRHVTSGRQRTVGILVAWLGGALFAASLIYAGHAYETRFGPMPAAAASSASVLPPALADLLLFTVFALHHSVFARTGAKAWLRRVIPAEYERTAYVWIASALFIVVCRAWQPVPGTLWAATGLTAVVLTGAQVVGVVLTIAASGQLDVLALAGIRQASASAGSRQPRLVARGYYRFVRHPIYFAWLWLVWPTPVMTGTRFAFAVISTAYLAAAIPFEERALRREFGDDYGRYMRQVRWRMLPGVY